VVLPAVTGFGLNESAVTTGSLGLGLTVIVALFTTVSYLAVMVTAVFLATAWPKSWNVVLLAPTGTVTYSGTPTAGSLLLSDTGASNEPVTMPVMVMVSVALSPARIEFGLMLIDLSVTPPPGSTSRSADAVTVPRVAATSIGHWNAVAEVVTVKETLVAP